MSRDELDRFFDLLQVQSQTLAEQGKSLAAIQQSMADTHERLFGNDGLHTQVVRHGKQIAMWKGAIAVLTILWGGAVALAATIMRHR